MPAKKYVIALNADERVALEKISASPHHSVREKKRARIVLGSDHNTTSQHGASQTDAQLCATLKVSALTVFNVRKAACERGALACITRQEQQKRKARKLEGRQEAHLVAFTCSTPPQGYARWTLVLLRERLIEMQVVESISLETIRTTLKKTRSNPG